MISQAYLREILSYDRETGFFRWRKARRGTAVNSIAGALSDRGYINIVIDGKGYRAHRLAWLFETGEWPKNDIDHKNNQRAQNWFDNLRPATGVQNRANQKRRNDCSTGFKGVTLAKHAGLYRARHAGKHLGYFTTAEEAHAAYCRKATELHGEFANSGASDAALRAALGLPVAGASDGAGE